MKTKRQIFLNETFKNICRIKVSLISVLKKKKKRDKVQPTSNSIRACFLRGIIMTSLTAPKCCTASTRSASIAASLSPRTWTTGDGGGLWGSS